MYYFEHRRYARIHQGRFLHQLSAVPHLCHLQTPSLVPAVPVTGGQVMPLRSDVREGQGLRPVGRSDMGSVWGTEETEARRERTPVSPPSRPQCPVRSYIPRVTGPDHCPARADRVTPQHCALARPSPLCAAACGGGPRFPPPMLSLSAMHIYV